MQTVLHLELKSSYYFLGLFSAIMFVVYGIVWTTVFPVQGHSVMISLVISVMLLIYFLWVSCLKIFRIAPQSVVGLSIQPDQQVVVYTKKGKRYLTMQSGECFVSATCVMLRLTDSIKNRSFSIVIFRDATAPKSFRRLCVLLKFPPSG